MTKLIKALLATLVIIGSSIVVNAAHETTIYNGGGVSISIEIDHPGFRSGSDYYASYDVNDSDGNWVATIEVNVEYMYGRDYIYFYISTADGVSAYSSTQVDVGQSWAYISLNNIPASAMFLTISGNTSCDYEYGSGKRWVDFDGDVYDGGIYFVTDIS